jgi:hypothetical protein
MKNKNNFIPSIRNFERTGRTHVPKPLPATENVRNLTMKKNLIEPAIPVARALLFSKYWLTITMAGRYMKPNPIP